MATRRAANRPNRSGITRQPTSWSRGVFQTITVPAATKVLIGSFTLENPGISETVRRTRGTMLIESDQSAAVEKQLGAMGWIIITANALAAGAASIPGPVTDAADDAWFVWEPIVGSSASTDGAGINVFPDIAVPFDSKAMRKVEEPNVLAIMVENAHPTFGFALTIAFSVLASRTFA